MVNTPKSICVSLNKLYMCMVKLKPPETKITLNLINCTCERVLLYKAILHRRVQTIT